MRPFLLSSAFMVTVAGFVGAALIPGGGPPRTDCYLMFDVGGQEVSARAVECTDGDPTCDSDGECDGTCRFQIAVCLNQNDPRLPNCTPPVPGSPLDRANELGRNPAGLLFPSFASSACGAFVGVDTPVTRRARPGQRIRALAVSPNRPRRDRDVLKLLCRARTGECPATTTTTTVTIPGGSTMTTTTLPGQQPEPFTPTADTGIFSGNPDATLGSFDQVFVGNDASNSQRGLLRFDLSAIPPSATVTSCSLTLNVVTHNQPGPGKIYLVKQTGWGETTATWNRYDGVVTWTTPGAFSPVEATSDVVVTPGPNGPVAYASPTTGSFTFPDITGLCQHAIASLNGNLNLMIKQDDDAPGAVSEIGFSRRTDSVESERPRLEVVLGP